MAVEEASGAGYLVEGEAAAFTGEFVDRLEDLEAQRDQLLRRQRISSTVRLMAWYRRAISAT